MANEHVLGRYHLGTFGTTTDRFDIWVEITRQRWGITDEPINADDDGNDVDGRIERIDDDADAIDDVEPESRDHTELDGSVLLKEDDDEEAELKWQWL